MFPSKWKHSDHKPAFIHWPTCDGQPFKSLYIPFMQATSASPQVNYVATCPMHSNPNVKESLPSFDLYSVVDMVISSIGILEPNIPTHIAALNMYSFQSVVMPSSEDLLEAMIEVCPLTYIPSNALSY
jgi:hypothetical protein